jgi:hypothetical protein
MAIKWLTTAPNPRSRATGHDAGQRGWKLHAIITDSDSFEEIRRQHALCGLRPAYGWGLDMFIEDKCQRCLNKIGRPQAVTAAEGYTGVTYKRGEYDRCRDDLKAWIETMKSAIPTEHKS